MRALFIPKPDAQQAGNGMHVHLSMTSVSPRQAPHQESHQASQTSQPRTPTTTDTKSSKSNVELAMGESTSAFIAGILAHLPALMSVTTPTTNSFRRLQPSCWAGVYRCWGVENKECPVRVCLDNRTHRPTHFE